MIQADGYSGYTPLCRKRKLIRIGCWGHVRRKLVDAIKSADVNNKSKASKADEAVGQTRKLYLIEKKIQHLTPEEKQTLRQQLSMPILIQFKQWLDQNAHKVVKDSKTRLAMDYALNQWHTLATVTMGT